MIERINMEIKGEIMRAFTIKQLKYLKLGGIHNENWTEDEKRGYLSSLSAKEKKDLDLYDECGQNCTFCVPTGKRIHTVMTRKNKKCPNCGNVESR
jgi:hypothetical protein